MAAYLKSCGFSDVRDVGIFLLETKPGRIGKKVFNSRIEIQNSCYHDLLISLKRSQYVSN